MNLSRCDFCGQTDDHPKVHFFDGRTHHHDCLSADQKAELAVSSDKAAAIIAAAESGKHGDELRAHILGLHEDHGEGVLTVPEVEA